MQFDEFVEVVQGRALFNTAGAAVRAIGTVLEVLGTCLARDEMMRLSLQLPQEIRSFLLQPGKAEEFGLEEFLKRVSEKEGGGQADAGIHARAVLSAIAESIPPVELRKVLIVLPDEIRGLFAPMRTVVS